MKKILKILSCGVIIYLGVIIVIPIVFPAPCFCIGDPGIIGPRVVAFKLIALSPVGFGALVVGLIVGYIIARKQA